MSPRRNLPRQGGDARRGGGRAGSRDAGSADLDDQRVRRGVEYTATWGGEPMTVRVIPGGSAAKPYRCPGCEQEIPPGTAHVVAWRTEGLGGLDDRRHWHTGCWRAREHRVPGVWRAGRRGGHGAGS